MPEPLTLEPEEMRRLGYAVIDRIVAHLDGLDDSPPVRVGDPQALAAAVGGPRPLAAPGDPEVELATLFEQVLPWGQRADHPRFFARIGSPSTYVGALADAAAAGVNAFAGSWTGGSGPSTVELTVLEWLREWCGMPEGSSGVLTSGGSLASLTGFAAARGRIASAALRGTGVVYVSDQAHASLPRAVALMGERTRVLESDDGQLLPVEALRRAVAEDRANGLDPFCVVATAGTTSTGAIICCPSSTPPAARLGLWLHVDGAYGAPAALTDAGAAALDGLGLADSLVMDSNNWLFQPYEIGCLLVRDPALLEQVFSLEGAYLRDTVGGTGGIRDRELTRGARGLKLWLSVRTFGLDAFRAAIAHGIALADTPRVRVYQRDGWELVTPASLGIVTFRRLGLDDDAHTRLAAATVEDGYAAPSTTVVGGRVVLRLCTINPRTRFEEVDATLDRMERLCRDVLGPHARFSGPISATERQPARPIVRSKSAAEVLRSPRARRPRRRAPARRRRAGRCSTARRAERERLEDVGAAAHAAVEQRPGSGRRPPRRRRAARRASRSRRRPGGRRGSRRRCRRCPRRPRGARRRGAGCP